MEPGETRKGRGGEKCPFTKEKNKGKKKTGENTEAGKKQISACDSSTKGVGTSVE